MTEIIRKKCEHGHFYNAAQFISCPHCMQGELEQIGDQTRSIAKYAQEYIREIQYGADPATEARARKRYVGAEKNERHPQDMQREELAADEKTIGFASERKKDYFVTGWAVCTEGPERGRTYSLYFGYNTINKNCSIIYEDRKNKFFLIPEEHVIVTINESEINKVTELHTGDIIRIGENKLEFVAFCRDDRKWERAELRRR